MEKACVSESDSKTHVSLPWRFDILLHRRRTCNQRIEQHYVAELDIVEPLFTREDSATHAIGF
jgi:hypothetical protein